MVSSTRYQKSGREAGASRLRETTGEILPNGDIVDLIRRPSGLALIRYRTGQPVEVAPKIKSDGTWYRPRDLNPAILDAMPFPQGISEYGTDQQLFDDIANVFCELGELALDAARAFACGCRATFVAELISYFPTIRVIATTTSQAFRVLQLVLHLSRRGLLIAQLTRGLPFFLGPTLIINDQSLSVKQCGFWDACNYPNTFVCGPKDALSRLACPRVVLSRPEDPPDLWGENAISIMLPAKAPLPLSSQVLTEIAAQFQPKLELYRLRKLAGEIPDPLPQQLPGADLAHLLAPSIPADASEILESLRSLFESRQEELRKLRSLDERVVIIEILWEPAHTARELTATDIADRVSALLRQRGDPRRYNDKEIGWRLRRLGLRRTRGIFSGSPDNRQRIHQLAAEFDLELPVMDGCPDCAKRSENKAVM